VAKLRFRPIAGRRGPYTKRRVSAEHAVERFSEWVLSHPEEVPFIRILTGDELPRALELLRKKLK
jgi:hypothetical protein